MMSGYFDIMVFLSNLVSKLWTFSSKLWTFSSKLWTFSSKLWTFSSKIQIECNKFKNVDISLIYRWLFNTISTEILIIFKNFVSNIII